MATTALTVALGPAAIGCVPNDLVLSFDGTGGTRTTASSAQPSTSGSFGGSSTSGSISTALECVTIAPTALIDDFETPPKGGAHMLPHDATPGGDKWYKVDDGVSNLPGPDGGTDPYQVDYYASLPDGGRCTSAHAMHATDPSGFKGWGGAFGVPLGGPVDISTTTGIGFWVMSPTQTGVGMSVTGIEQTPPGGFPDGGTGAVKLYRVTQTGPTWQLVRIPWVDFDAAGTLATISQIQWNFNGTTDIDLWIDDVHFY